MTCKRRNSQTLYVTTPLVVIGTSREFVDKRRLVLTGKFFFTTVIIKKGFLSIEEPKSSLLS